MATTTTRTIRITDAQLLLLQRCIAAAPAKHFTAQENYELGLLSGCVSDTVKDADHGIVYGFCL